MLYHGGEGRGSAWNAHAPQPRAGTCSADRGHVAFGQVKSAPIRRKFTKNQPKIELAQPKAAARATQPPLSARPNFSRSRRRHGATAPRRRGVTVPRRGAPRKGRGRSPKGQPAAACAVPVWWDITYWQSPLHGAARHGAVRHGTARRAWLAAGCCCGPCTGARERPLHASATHRPEAPGLSHPRTHHEGTRALHGGSSPL